MSARTVLAHSFSRWLPSLPISVLLGAISGGVKQILPTQVGSVRQWILMRVRRAHHEPCIGHVRFGSLRRLTPISRTWGFDRGGPIDRYYIERFLADHREDICGRVLEISENLYTRKFGSHRVTQSDVLDLTWQNPQATIVADLTEGKSIPSETFDCIVLTQTLHTIEDTRAAIETLHRILKPGGTLLATLPGISQVKQSDWGGYWCGGYRSARRMFAHVFSDQHVDVQTYGNVLAAIAFLEGLGVTELSPQELDYYDPDFEVTIGVRAVK